MTSCGVMIGLDSLIILFCAVLYSIEDAAAPINFVETYFSFSPDNGDGSIEILLVVMLAIFAAAIGLLSLRSPVK